MTLEYRSRDSAPKLTNGYAYEMLLERFTRSLTVFSKITYPDSSRLIARLVAPPRRSGLLPAKIGPILLLHKSRTCGRLVVPGDSGRYLGQV
jgi:hypothetical protein